MRDARLVGSARPSPCQAPRHVKSEKRPGAWLAGLVLGVASGVVLLTLGTYGMLYVLACVGLVLWKGPRFLACAGMVTGVGLVSAVLFARVALTCGGPLERRADDQADVILRRLALYDEQSAPLLVWLDSQGILVTVDGTGAPDEVHERIFDAVAHRVPAVRDLVR